MGGKPRAARQGPRQRQGQRTRLELAGDRADAEADGEQASAEQEDRVLEPDRRPLGERVEPDEVEQAAELLRLRLQLLGEDLAGREDGDEQEAPDRDQQHLERQADELLAGEAENQRAVHEAASSR